MWRKKNLQKKTKKLEKERKKKKQKQACVGAVNKDKSL